MKRIISLALVAYLALICFPALADVECWYLFKYKMHDFEQVDVKLQTCETDGYYLLECRQCGYNEKQITGKATGHSWEMIQSENATCDKAGYEKYECQECYITRTTTLSMLHHNWVDDEVLKEATCAHEGSVRVNCTLCNASNSRSIPKTPHKYGDWEVTVQATDHSRGERARSCSACGNSVSEGFYPEGTLYRGMDKSDSVAACQRMLIELDILKDKADGVFGKKTEQAVKDFQSAAGFEVTGIAYPQTLAAIADSLNAPTNPTEEPTETLAPFANPAIDEAPVFSRCAPYIDVNGIERVGYCPDHKRMIEEFEARLEEAETDDAYLLALNAARGEWQAELDRLYDLWLASASPEEQPSIAQAKSMFALYLNNQEALWARKYADSPATVTRNIVNALINQCADLCALAEEREMGLERFTFSRSGMSVNSVYSYSVMRTEKGYLAGYELNSGGNLFSIWMDEEDVTEFLAMVRACGLLQWDGFEETDPNASDGESFAMSIAFTDGASVSASGSNAFPEGYDESEEMMRSFFHKLMHKNGVVINE